MNLSARQEEVVRHSLAEAARSLEQRSSGMPGGGGASGPPPEWMPVLGTTATRTFTVGEEDTAAAMGHPDPEVRVLGSPRLALWFEMAATGALAVPPAGMRHLGVGILVHHLGAAHPGEEVVVRVTVTAVEGCRMLFDCEATVGHRLVGFGTHHRLVRAVPSP